MFVARDLIAGFTYIFPDLFKHYQPKYAYILFSFELIFCYKLFFMEAMSYLMKSNLQSHRLFWKTLLHISFKHDILLYFWKKWSILQFHECDSNLVCFLSYILLDLNLCFYDHVFKLNLSQKKIMGPESWVVSKMLWIMGFGFGSCILLVGLRYEIWQLYVQC